MPNIHVPDDLWATTMAPLGVLERWRAEAGQTVLAGQAIAEVRVEDALHELSAPCSGQLSTFAKPNDLVAPGVLIGRIEEPAVH